MLVQFGLAPLTLDTPSIPIVSQIKQHQLNKASSIPRGNFLLLTPQNDIVNIFTVLFGFDIINIAVVSYDKNSFVVYSWDAFAEGSQCGKKPKPLIHRCENATITYKSDLKNLNRCKIKLVSKYETSRDFSKSIFITLMYKLIDVLTEVVNATLQDIVTENQENFLYEKEQGITLSVISFILPKLIEQYDVSDLVYQDNLVWAVPKPREIANVILILSVFGKTLWGVMVTSFATVVFTWWISAKFSYQYQYTYFKDFFRCFLATLSFSLGIPFNLTTITNPTRCIAFSYLFYSVVVITCFQANLISDLTRPTYDHGIKTIEEIWESSLRIMLRDDGRITHIIDDKYEKYANKVILADIVNFTQYLEWAAFHRNITFTIGRRSLKVYVKENNLINVIDNNNMPGLQLLGIMRKGHYFMPTFSKYMRRLVEFGFHEKILSDAERHGYTSTEEKLEVALTLEHLNIDMYMFYTVLAIQRVQSRHKEKLTAIKMLNELLVVISAFNIITTVAELSNESSLLHLLQTLVSSEETLQFIYDDYEGYNQLIQIPNPCIVTHIDKPIRRDLNFYNTYVIFTSNHTSLNRTLTKLRRSYLWNQTNSPRGEFIVLVSSYIDTKILTDIFHKYNLVKFAAFQKISNFPQKQPSRNQGYFKSEKSSILDFSIQNCTYSMRYISVPTVQEREIKMILPYPVAIATTDSPVFKGVFGLGLEFLKIIGKLFKMNASQAFTNNTKALMYHKNNNIYVLLSTTRDMQLYEDYDVSNFFFRDTLNWAVPTPERISTFKTIVTTLDFKVWLAIITILITESILWWLFSKPLKTQVELVNVEICILSSFFIMLGGSSLILPKTNSLRVLLLFYLFYAMQVSTIFQGKLFSGLTDPNLEHGITTMEELTESPLPMIGSPKTKEFTTEYFSNHPVYSKILTKLIVQHPMDLEGNLINIVRFKNCSSVIGKAVLYYCYPKFKHLVRLIERNTSIIEFELTVATRKGHYFWEILNKLSNRVMETGINLKMFSDATVSFSSQAIEDDQGASVLTTYHVSGLFIFWAIGLLLAILVFIVEMYPGFCKKNFVVNI
ncbi:hypothetical protein ILUMI_12239 [Ignelater luminosus]|uniref:Ionotropic receptor n=1 Tax=Ignelater luminosus TaxID=2038154 RepID=A0A8K0CWU5_IGNLU|nr:hypothetical protein ILUMI_12239 [Ignelater luminosus]